jgi:hypothetical protein
VAQPGYHALADRYAEMFPGPYQFPVEQHTVAAFVAKVSLVGRPFRGENGVWSPCRTPFSMVREAVL